MSRPVEVVGAALLRGGRLLAARRGPGRQAGLWELPGGKVEAGESRAAALARELREELGIAVEVLDEVAVHTHDYGDLLVRLHALRCRLRPGSPEPEAREHAELRWLRAGELDAVDWAPADRPLVAAVRALLSEA